NSDLIILDLAVTGRNGLDMARDWRQMGIKTPILIGTAMDSTEAKVKGLDTGADDYITKPFAFAELLARIRALQRRTAAEDTTKLQLGDLALDLINRRATPARNGVQFATR